MRPPRETSRARSIIGVRVGHSTTRPCDALRRRWSGQTKRAASRETLPHSTMTRLTRITRITRSKGRAQRGLAVPSATFCCTTHFCWRVLDAEIWRALPGRQARRERWLHAAASRDVNATSRGRTRAGRPAFPMPLLPPGGLAHGDKRPATRLLFPSRQRAPGQLQGRW